MSLLRVSSHNKMTNEVQSWPTKSSPYPQLQRRVGQYLIEQAQDLHEKGAITAQFTHPECGSIVLYYRETD